MDLLNKYIFFTLLFIFPHYFYSQGCSVDRSAFLNKTLAETFYKNEQTIKIVFSCKVINSTVTATGSAYSIAEIKDVFFGKTNLKQIKISSGYFVPPPPPKPPPLLIPPPKPIKKTNYNVPYIDDDEILIDQDYRGSTNWGIKMMKDSIYIIYSTNDTAFVRSYLEFSKQLKETSAIRNEIEILKKFDGIFKNKMSGHFIF